MAAPVWRIESGAILTCGCARLAIQRIGLAHWRPLAVLRSWGIAPLHGDPGRVNVPCADDEALWLGLWCETGQVPVGLSLADARRGAQARAYSLSGRASITALETAVPEESPALGTATGRSQDTEAPRRSHDGAPAPDTRRFEPVARLGSLERTFVLQLELGDGPVRLQLCLLPPGDWSARSGRPAPAALGGPPPEPPRLG